MIDKIINYLQKYLTICAIVHFTFIVPFLLSSGYYSAEGFESGHFKRFIQNEIDFVIAPILTIAAGLLIILSLYSYFKNKSSKKQLILSLVLSLLIIIGIRFP